MIIPRGGVDPLIYAFLLVWLLLLGVLVFTLSLWSRRAHTERNAGSLLRAGFPRVTPPEQRALPSAWLADLEPAETPMATPEAANSPARLEAGPPARAAASTRPRDVALFLDVRTFRNGTAPVPNAGLLAAVRVAAASTGVVTSAHAYVSTPTPARAAVVARAFEESGYKSAIRIERAKESGATIALAIDALRAADAGKIVVLATHDPTLAPLAAELRRRGAALHIVGLSDRLPDPLRKAGDIICVVEPALGKRRGRARPSEV